MEGAHGLRDHVDNSVQVIEDILRENAQDDVAVFGKETITRFIARRIAAHVMGAAIDLNDKPQIEATEVRNVSTDRMLSAKFHA